MCACKRRPDIPWEQFKFSIIGRLLAKPPDRGELQNAIENLSKETYQHPTKDEPIVFGFSTIEKWYYAALSSPDPLTALKRKVRTDIDLSKVMGPDLLNALNQQYRLYSSWSYQLHHDNLAALTREKPELGNAPSYATIYRQMMKHGWVKKRISPRAMTKGQQEAQQRLESREVRSYESSHVHGLYHLDFHDGSRRVVDDNGQWHIPQLLCILDDRSRLVCHIQWYLQETTADLIHGLTQAFQKRGLPRSLMSDRGPAMMSHEFCDGLLRLGILHEPTLAYSPYQNGKQESFWGQVEGRLLPMLKRVEPLTLTFLNEATQAWAELEYNHARHDELGCSPLQRLQEGPTVDRPCPDSKNIRFHFTHQVQRTQRKSDGTIKILGVRFELPSRFRFQNKVTVRYKRWDLSRAYLVDARQDSLLARIYPLDKTKNSSGMRRTLAPLPENNPAPLEDAVTQPALPPLMRQLLADYASTGLAPAYIPKTDDDNVPSQPQKEEHSDE